jgi:hypothetical protein
MVFLNFRLAISSITLSGLMGGHLCAIQVHPTIEALEPRGAEMRLHRNLAVLR